MVVMHQESGILKINIYGTEYPIKSDAQTDPDYIKSVAEFVDKKMREIDENTQSKSSIKVAVLAALNITDELFQDRASKESLYGEMEEKIKNLSNKLDQSIQTSFKTE